MSKWFVVVVAFSACRKRSAVSVIRWGGLDPSGKHEEGEANFLHCCDENKQCITHHRQRRQGLSAFINYKCIRSSVLFPEAISCAMWLSSNFSFAPRQIVRIKHLIISTKTWSQPCFVSRVLFRLPRSIYQHSNMAPRVSGQNYKFVNFLLSLNSQKRLRYRENHQIVVTDISNVAHYLTCSSFLVVEFKCEIFFLSLFVVPVLCVPGCTVSSSFLLEDLMHDEANCFFHHILPN